MDERERQKLVQKLKTVRTSEERDRILWQLAGQEKAVKGKPQRPSAADTGKPAAAKTESRTQIRLPLGKLGGFGFITALLFLFYGMVAIVSAVMKIFQGHTDRHPVPQKHQGLFTGLV